MSDLPSIIWIDRVRPPQRESSPCDGYELLYSGTEYFPAISSIYPQHCEEQGIKKDYSVRYKVPTPLLATSNAWQSIGRIMSSGASNTNKEMPKSILILEHLYVNLPKSQGHVILNQLVNDNQAMVDGLGFVLELHRGCLLARLVNPPVNTIA